MSLEAMNLAVSAGTLVVISATAFAALVQLRHIQRANQLAGLQNVFGMLLDPSVRELVNFVRHDLAQRMKDPAFRAGLLEIPVDRSVHPELYLCDMYNHVGSFIRSGLIDERIYLQTEWYNVNLYWELLREVVMELRRVKPFVLENFEWLAQRAQNWALEHPRGDYPPDARHLIGVAVE